MQSNINALPISKCTACGTEKPLSKDYFQEVPSFAKGYSFYCNSCAAESQKQKALSLKKFAVDFILHNDIFDRGVDSPV